MTEAAVIRTLLRLSQALFVVTYVSSKGTYGSSITLELLSCYNCTADSAVTVAKSTKTVNKDQ